MKRFNISVNGHAYDVQVEEVAAGGATAAVPTAAPAAPAAPAPAPAPAAAPAAPAPAAAAPAGAETINAPMPGNIVNVQVKVGDTVIKGQAVSYTHLDVYKRQDSTDRLVNLVPDLVDKVTGLFKKDKDKEKTEGEETDVQPED